MGRHDRWARRLEVLDEQGLRRRLRTLSPTGPVTGEVEGRELTVFASNDYLGLAWALRGQGQGGGTGSSRLISGDRPVHRALEGALEERLGKRVLLFPSGWQANAGVLATAFDDQDVVASDALNHASVIDGLRLSKARRVVVPHGRPDLIPPEATAVVVEGLYSMDGDTPDFAKIPRDPWLFVDEAHAFGCLGPEGRGVAAAQGVVPDVIVGTFGKALGSAGAFVAGPDPLIELMISSGRAFLFTTGVAEPLAALALAGLQRADDDLRGRLAHNADRLRRGLRQLGWDPLGDNHIIAVVAGPQAMAMAARLFERGFWVPAIRYPTVARGTERLRITVSAAHSDAQVDGLLEAMGAAER